MRWILGQRSGVFTLAQRGLLQRGWKPWAPAYIHSDLKRDADMDRMQEIFNRRIQAFAKGTEIERVTDDADVRSWLVMGRMAMFFCMWMAFIIPVALVLSLRF